MKRRAITALLWGAAALLGATAWAASGDDASEAGRTIAVVTFGDAGDDGTRCAAHELSDLVAEQLGRSVPAGWAVLARPQVMRRERDVAPPGEVDSARLPEAATALSATVVIGGEVTAGQLALTLYDVRKGRSEALKPNALPADDAAGGAAPSVKTVLARLAPGTSPAPVERLVRYPAAKGACAAFAQARVSFDRKDTKSLKRTFALAQKALRGAPDNPRVQAFVAQVAARLSASDRGTLEQGRALAHKALQGAPELTEVHWAQGLVLDYADEIEPAIAAYRKGAALDRGFGDLRTNLGMLLLARGRLGEALATLGEALELDRGSDIARINLAVARVVAGDGSGAMASLEPVRRDSRYLDKVRLLRGQALSRLGRTDEAISMLRPLTTGKGPQAVEARYETGLAHLLAGRQQPAVEAFTAVAEQPEPGLATRAKVGLALTKLAGGAGGEAARLVDELAGKDAARRFPILLRAQAVLAARQGKAAEARATLEALLAKADANDHEALYDLGVLHQRAERWEAAAEAYRRALAINPRASWAQHNLGLVALRRGRLPQAVEALRATVALDPRSGDAANALGVALWRSGQAEEALAAWRAFVTRAGEAMPNLPVPARLTSNLKAAEGAR